jgi:hypothetical protein
VTASDTRRDTFNAVPVELLDGHLRLGHADNFDGGPSEFFYAIVADTRQYRIRLGTLLPGLENGMRAIVSGRIGTEAELVPDRIIIIAAPESKVTRDFDAKAIVNTSYIVIPVKFPTNSTAPFTYGTDPFTTASLATSVFGVAPAISVAEYYKETSFGQQLLSGVVADNGSGGWLLAEVPKPATCDISAIATAAENAAGARGYNIASYVGRVYVFTNNVPGCSWSGLAYVNWERSWIKQTSSLLVIGHELGHNFGLLHAASVDCGTNVIGGSCTSSEYGDPFGIMGNSRAMHVNAAQKAELGWIPSSSVKTHSKGRGTYTLGPLESPDASTYAVKISAATKRSYWLEYRQPIGFDSALAAFPNNGAQFRVAAPFESLCTGCSDDTQFLDMMPSTSTFTDGTLVAGSNYTDAMYGIRVSVVSATPTALTLDVVALGEPTAPDFDFSGTTDLLWQNSVTKQTAMWQMSGLTASASHTIFGDGTWGVIRVGDLNGDGNADILWRNSLTGHTAAWLMNGGSTLQSAVLSSDPSWSVSHVADLNGDGSSDLIWRNSTSGQTAVWLMNGLSASAASIIHSGSAWAVSHAGDFNADGKADLVWHNATTGQTAIWLMNGVTTTAAASIYINPSWSVGHVADLNGDGRSDLVWRSSATGQTAVWLMNGTTSTSAAIVFSDPNWQVSLVSDLNGDGKSDLIWRNSSLGQTAIWLMNGIASTASAVISSNAASAVSHSGDFNGDGNADLVWRNSSNGSTSLWLMSGTSVLSQATLMSDPGWSALAVVP